MYPCNAIPDDARVKHEPPRVLSFHQSLHAGRSDYPTHPESGKFINQLHLVERVVSSTFARAKLIVHQAAGCREFSLTHHWYEKCAHR